MNSKTDQVQAHKFMLERLSSALLRIDPDAQESPLRRTYRGSFIGALVAALACVGLLIFGLVSPGGNKTWRVDGALVVVDETGARFLYAGGRLLPVLNLVSAKLVAGDKLVVHHVAEASLKDVPRGDPLGIVGAPDALPGLAADPWEVCASIGRDRPGEVRVWIGGPLSGTPVTDDEAVVATTPDGATALLWKGRRSRIATDRNALDAVDGVVQPVPVPASLLDALPVGPDFAPPAIAGLGGPGPKLGAVDSRIGQLFTVHGEAQQYVATATGLVPVSALGARLLTVDPQTRRQVPAEVTALPGRVVSDHLSADPSPELLSGAPPRAAKLVGQQGLCARVTPDGNTPRTHVALAATMPGGGAAMSQRPGVTPPCARVDRIGVRPGSGALVRATTAAGRPGDAQYLVADNGVKYPLPGEAAQTLGYSGASAIGLPAPLLELLATGGPLDPAALGTGGTVLPPVGVCGS